MTKTHVPVVAVVGRPNVGKSTLFNRMVGRRKAVVDPTPGVTRDRHSALCDQGGWQFELVDTGGLDYEDDGRMTRAIVAQSEQAVSEADLAILLVDAKEGLLPPDRQAADVLRRGGKPIILAVNKIDHASQEDGLYDFYQLGFEDVFPISALHGRAVNSLFDRVVEMLRESGLARRVREQDEEEETGPLAIAVVGRPNVGKSSLVNAILGQNRVLVDEAPGTTRDAIDTLFRYEGQEFVLVDTAGLRRKSRKKDDVEYYSTQRAISAMDRCHVAVLVLDAAEEVTGQDTKIAGLALDAGCGVILAVNKWDLVEKDSSTIYEQEKLIRGRLKYLSFAPLLFISALTRRRVTKVVETAREVGRALATRIPTPELNNALAQMTAHRPPPSVRGKTAHIYYLTQTGTFPPRFRLFMNNPDRLHFSYERYIVNQLRQRYGFVGAPIRIETAGRKG